MISQLLRGLQRFATPPRLLVLLPSVLVILLSLNFLNLPFSIPRLREISGGRTILDLRFFYSSDEAYRTLDAFGLGGRFTYLWGLATVDAVLPALMALLLAVTLVLVLKGVIPATSAWQRLCLVPILGALADYCENAAIITLLLRYPTRLEAVATAAGWFTLTKQVVTLLCVSMIAVGSVARMTTWFKGTSCHSVASPEM
jgi:hypothetical protein